MYRKLAFVTLILVVFGWGSLVGAQTTQPIKVTVWYYTGQEVEHNTIKAQVNEFNGMQDEIQVKLVSLPEATYTDQVRAAGLAGQLPDLMSLDGPTLANFVWSGFLRPLDEFVTLELYKDLLPSIIEQGTYSPDGKLYAIGVFDSGLAIWGNKAYLQEAGVRIPTSVDDAWTREEFEQALEKLTVLDEVQWPLDLKLNYGPGEWFTYGFSPILQSFGGDLIDRKTWKAKGTLDSPKSISAMSMLQSWVNKGWVVPASAGDDAFYGAKSAALAYVGMWMWVPHKQGLEDDLILLPMPRFGDRAATGMGSWCWGISPTTENPEAAWKFLEFLLQPDQILRMTDVNGAPPSRLSAIERSLPYGPGGAMNIYGQQLQTIAVPRPVHPAYPMITSAFAEALKNIVAGGDVAGELAKAAAKIDQDIEDNEGYPPFGE